ncbi:restriction endonuclease [Candidatus Bathyarchaeota archaeon]|nr:restriction endonuclease [Candidatus Bathyarchaeota archaeon]
MVIERDLLLSLLKLTKDGPVLIKCVNQDARIASDIVRKLLEKLQNEGMLYLKEGTVEADSDNRLKIAVKAASLGADVEHISAFLRWQEFEDIAAIALERNGYVVAKNVRFKHAGRRWEIDVVGCRKPLVLCVDCKRWQRGVKASALRKIVEAQVERAHALADTLPSPALTVECVKWKKAKIVPVILSLIPSSLKFYDNVPVVPILQLQDFLIQLPAYVESLKYFVKEFSHL